MVNARDVLLGIIGFSISFYGGKIGDLKWVVTGILIIVLTIWLNFQSQQEDINILKAQINTKDEVNRVWREIGEIKNKGKKRQG